jgi:hypothetical protein
MSLIFANDRPDGKKLSDHPDKQKRRVFHRLEKRAAALPFRVRLQVREFLMPVPLEGVDADAWIGRPKTAPDVPTKAGTPSDS